MSMIDRYKKKGGFVQLVILIETTGPDKREKFLKMIADENPTWEAAIKNKMLTLDRISNWNQSFLMEFMPQIPAMVTACALFPLAEDKKQKILGALSFGDRKKVDEVLKDHKPNSGEIVSSQNKIFTEIRTMVASNKLKFEKFDETLVIPENYEEMLMSGAADIPVSHEVISEVAHSPSHTSVASTSGNGGSEELTLLRRKLVALTQETTFLKKENKELKEKLEGIKEALRKIA